MKERLEKRLQELKTEFEKKKKMLAELEERQANLRSSLLRISGAIQVLEEELCKCEGDSTEPLPVQEVRLAGSRGESQPPVLE